jgi:hypothetical protein
MTRVTVQRLVQRRLPRGLREASQADASGGLWSFAIVAGFAVVIESFLVGHAAMFIRATSIRRRCSATSNL